MKCLLVIMLAISSYSHASELAAIWEIDGFKMPESVVWDKHRDQGYVSNMNMNPFDRDANGSISLIQSDGKTHQIDWITGLHSPKGMELIGNFLYVADVNELVVINVETASITARYSAPKSPVLNGITKTKDGDIYVSDWTGNRIYKLHEQELLEWLHSPKLESPNGLFAKGKYLYVAAWGKNPKPDFSTQTSGKLKRISLKTKAIEDLYPNDKTFMNLDGIHRKKSSWLVTDFMKGDLIVLDKNGRVSQRYNIGQSAADFFYQDKGKLVIVPFLMQNRVTAYQLKD